MSKQGKKTYTATTVSATVLVKCIGTAGAGNTPAEIADNIAEAISHDSSRWMMPVLGIVQTPNGESFDIETVEFGQEVTWIQVDEYDAQSGKVVKINHFDRALRPMNGNGDYATAKEAELTAQVKFLQEQLRAAIDMVGTLRSALDDASSVVDKSDCEDYAYQAELEASADFLRIEDSSANNDEEESSAPPCA